MAAEQRWWTLTEDENVHGAVMSVVTTIRQENGDARRIKNRQYIGLYENRDLDSFPLEGISIPAAIQTGNLTLNVCGSCVDTLASKIAPNKPKPMFLTVDGDFAAQMRAKNLQRFVDGNFHAGEVYRKSVDVFLDAGVCDIGALKVGAKGNTICYERVFPNELYVDERAALHGKPRELFQEKWIPTDILVSRFPADKKEMIETSASNRDITEGQEASGVYEDMVQVIEAWRLPSGDGEKDGRHIIVVKGGVLFNEKWTDDCFPFAFLRWSKVRQGFFGQGLVEQLHGIQQEITELVQKIQQAHRILGIPWVLKPAGSTVKEGSITNEIGETITYDGPAPQVDVHGIMAAEVYNHLNYLYEKAFEVSGISQLSASSRKPAGIESGVALRTLLDTETQRFALLVEAYQEYILDVARQTIKQAKRMGKAATTWRMREWTRKIEWNNVNMDEDRYVMQLWPVALLPDTPAGKLAYTEQMITMGLLSPEQAQSLLDFPDVEAFQRTSNAARDLIEMIVEDMLRSGEYTAPSKYMPLVNPADGSPGLAVQIVQGSLLRAQVNGWPEDRQALLAQWLEDAARIAAPPPPMPPTGPMPPGAGPPGPPSPEGQPPGPLPEGAPVPPGMEGAIPPTGLPV